MTMRNHRFRVAPEPLGRFDNLTLIVPQQFCADCHWHVHQPNMPTFWAGGRDLLCVFCAELRAEKVSLRPLHRGYADLLQGVGPVLTGAERSRLLRSLGARTRPGVRKVIAA